MSTCEMQGGSEAHWVEAHGPSHRHPGGARPHGAPCAPQVQQLERSIGLKDLAMAELEQKVHEMQATTFDGVFIWKISDFARKRQEAVAGRTPAIFSPGAVWDLPSELRLSDMLVPPRLEPLSVPAAATPPRWGWVFRDGTASGDSE